MRSHLSAITAAVIVAPALLTVATAPAHAAAPRCGGLTATILGTPGKDTINGTRGDDVIIGRAGRDKILGGGGNDVICGSRGRDQINGGHGNDRVRGQRGRDELGGGPGNDHLNGGAGTRTDFEADAGDDVFLTDSTAVWVDFGHAPGPVSVDLGAGTASGWGNDAFHFGLAFVQVGGSTFADSLVGSDRSDGLYGVGSGVGHLIPTVSGFDTIDGKGGGDVLVAREGVILGGAGNDNLKFENGPSTQECVPMTPEGDDRTLVGGPGNDSLHMSWCESGPPEVFSIAGGDGIDLLRLSGPINDPSGAPVTFDMTTGALDLGGTSGTASGLENFDAWGAGAVDVVGTDGPNVLDFFDTGPVTVHALAGNDVMDGDQGDDTLDGGLGDDTAIGWGGTDTCISIEHATNCEILNP